MAIKLLTLMKRSPTFDYCIANTFEYSSFSSQYKLVEPKDWKAEHVVAWLHDNGLGQHAPVFRQNKVDGAALLAVDDESLKKLGVDVCCLM